MADMSSESYLSEFLQNFSPISLRHSKPELGSNPWVFWSESEGTENNSSSDDVGTPMMYDMIKSALSNIRLCRMSRFVGQFWAPVTIGGRRVLSTSGQPFAVRRLSHEFAMYRLNSEKYKYDIDANNLDIEPDHMILSGGPATAFLNCRTSINKLQEVLLNFSVMVPICFPSQSNCIGVLEFTFDYTQCELAYLVFHRVKAIKKAGLDVFYVQDLIPYKTTNGLKVAKDEIQEALKVVCELHNLNLAQVWIPCEDKDNVPFSYSLEDTQTKGLSAIKLTGYLYAEPHMIHNDFHRYETYYSFCDVVPSEKELIRKTLQDNESRFISKLRYDSLVDWEANFIKTSALAICLRSVDTGDIDYAFEFLWYERSNSKFMMEAILLTLKRFLPRFKFASGGELGDEVDVIVVQNITDSEGSEVSETEKIKIFQGKRSSPEGKKPMAVDFMGPSDVACKTTPKVLPREVIEKQFGKTMKEAAKELNVSLSTLKRKSKELGIIEWPRRSFMKRNINDSSIIQINTNEDDNGAIKGTSTVNPNKNVLTIKAEYEDDMIKFNLPISQATFVNVEKEIGMKLKLIDRTYKLKYLDKDDDWITLTSDEEMADCIKSSRKSDENVVRMLVLRNQYQVLTNGFLGTVFV